MSLAVSPPSRCAGWRCLLMLALASTSLPVAAQSMACGNYKQVDGMATLTIESEGHGVIRNPLMPSEPLRLGRQGNVLGVGNLATGRLENWEFSENDRTLSGGLHDYRLERAATCKPMPEAAEGSCLADPGSCLEALPQAEPEQLVAWCGEGVGAACNRLLEIYQEQAEQAQPQTASREPPMPEFCQEQSRAFDPEACMAIAEAMAGDLMGKAMLGLSRVQDPLLPAAQLEQLMTLCWRQQGETFCNDVAEALWADGRLLDAREALQLSCGQRADSYACGPVQSLALLPAEALQAVDATVLPCGSYTAEHGLLSRLRIGDAGLVEVDGLDTRLRARLQDGRIHIRRDMGDDFVLMALRDGNLLGMDADNRFAYYQRQPGAAASCQPARSFVEIPLPLDCPTLKRSNGAEACCSDGKLLGCKVAGEQRASAGQWPQAQPYFETLCRAGVREGCLALASVHAHTADPNVPATLAAICAEDGKGSHVACDVDATRNWPALKARATR